MSKTSQRKQAKKQDDAALRFKIRIGGGVIGPGKVRLLEEIAEARSISAAAREMGMNYRRAQYLLKTLKDGLGGDVVKTAVGGSKGGGASLTPLGQAIVDEYAHIGQEIEAAVSPRLDEFSKTVKSLAGAAGDD
jgi:molybdate transport system regulatory protein